MNKEKQIEEMAKDLCKYATSLYCASGECVNHNCLVDYRALEILYDKGYRKADEVAREICESIIEYSYVDSHGDFVVPVAMIEMIEKKYTEGEG